MRMCMGCMENYSEEYHICPYCGYAEDAKAAEALHMEPGSILRGRYIIGKVLGFGGFGVTYIGWDALLEQKVAVKEYLPSEFSTRVPGQTQVTVFNGVKQEQFVEGLGKFVEEAQRLARFHSMDGIVKIFDSFAENNTAYIIMEYLEGETLAERLKRVNVIPADEAVAMLTPVIKSLQVVHEQGIIHRDIAPDNIFITKDGNMKLIDFGAARFATTSYTRSLTVIIKPGYSPEEQYRSRGDQGPHTDVYAVGATLYRMITGTNLPEALERRAYFESKQKDILKPPSKLCPVISENYETAILNALNVRIEDRTPDMATFLAELSSDDIVSRRHGRIKKIDILKWPLWMKITATAAALVVVTLSALFMLGIIGPPPPLPDEIVIPDGMVRVPSVVNSSVPEGEERAKQAALQPQIVGKNFSDRIPANMILAQDINAGSVVMQMSFLNLTISAGAEMKTVPHVIGEYEDDAVVMLQSMRFAVQIEREYNSAFTANTVINQTPDGGTEAAADSIITLVISLGDDPEDLKEEVLTVVPDLIGMNYLDAISTLSGVGFKVSKILREFSEDFIKDIVMAQSVQAGSELMSGSLITLTVSDGFPEVSVSDVTYLEEEEAVRILEEQGLVPELAYVTSDTVVSGLVITQDPEPPQAVSPGTTVYLTVSLGRESFPMRNVVNMEESAAYSLLTSLGMSVAREYENSDRQQGTVIRQSIAEDTPVTGGTHVSITISSGQIELFTVPYVTGISESSARNDLTNAGFRVSVSYANSDLVATGYVISQSHASGTKHAKNTTIALTVSSGKPVVTVPNVTGKTQTAAESTLRDLGLNARLNEDFSNTVPKGSVVSQSPEPGASLYKGDSVTLVISKGKRQTTIPNVVGRSKSSAMDAIWNVGLNINVNEAYNDSVEYGIVISQSPASGSAAYEGDTVTITVSLGQDPDKITALYINPATLFLGKGKTSQLTVTTTPTYADQRNITWRSSNENVATVNSSGLVTAKAEGRATITASAQDGKVSAECTVNVTEINITLDEKSVEMDGGKTYQLNALIAGMTANSSVTWSVSGKGVTVSQEGLVTAQVIPINSISLSSTSAMLNIGDNARIVATVSTGSSATATVTATSKEDPSKKDSCTITVLPPDTALTWTTSDSNVADVSQDGYILAKADGTATITATSKADSTKRATCYITVKTDSIVSVISINTYPSKTTYKAGETLDMRGLSFNVRTESGKIAVEFYPSNLISQISPATVPSEPGSYSALIEFTTGDIQLVYYSVVS